MVTADEVQQLRHMIALQTAQLEVVERVVNTAGTDVTSGGATKHYLCWHEALDEAKRVLW